MVTDKDEDKVSFYVNTKYCSEMMSCFLKRDEFNIKPDNNYLWAMSLGNFKTILILPLQSMHWRPSIDTLSQLEHKSQILYIYLSTVMTSRY